MARYGKKAEEKVEQALHERKQGTLKSGSGRTVKSRKQAIAIALSEAREEGGKVPQKTARKASAEPKSGSRKPASTRTARKKRARKSASPGSTRKKTAAKKK